MGRVTRGAIKRKLQSDSSDNEIENKTKASDKSTKKAKISTSSAKTANKKILDTNKNHNKVQKNKKKSELSEESDDEDKLNIKEEDQEDNNNNLINNENSEEETNKNNNLKNNTKKLDNKLINKTKNDNSINKKSKQELDEKMDVDEVDDKIDLNESSFRRSNRKRTSRFSFKELVSSGDEDSDFDEDQFKNNSKKKVSIKEMNAKVKEFIGDGSESDDYKPTDVSSAESEPENDLEEEEENSNLGNDSDISDVLPKTKNKATALSSKSRFSKPKSYSGKTQQSDEIIAYKSTKTPKPGNPQADLLKNKIANFRPSQLPEKQIIDSSPFGNGSCVRKLLEEQSKITKNYEKFKKQHIDKTKNNEAINKDDLMKMLQEFETGCVGESESSINESKTSTKTTKNKVKDESDTDDDDFEEVGEAASDFEDYNPDCLTKGVTISLKPTFNNKKQKNENWIYDAIRQGINRQRRENCKNLTKINILAYLARVKYLNELTFDDELKSLALSIDFFKNLKTKTITQQFVTKFIEKFKSTFKFDYSKNYSKLTTSKIDIQKCFETKQTYHPTIYNLVFLILFRTFCSINSIDENSRLCIAFKPIDSKCDNLINKPRSSKISFKFKKDDELLNEEEEEKPSTSKSASKKATTSKKVEKSKTAKKDSKSKKKVDSEEDDDDVDENEEQLDEGFSEADEEEEEDNKKSTKRNTKKSKSAKSKTKPNSKAKSSSKENIDELVEDKKFQLQKKRLIEIWPEIYLEDKNQWYCVEPINEVYSTTPEELEKLFYVDALYILAFNSKRHLKDITSKYISNYFYHKFKRQRIEDEWLDQVYQSYRPLEPTQDELDEDNLIKENNLNKPLPKSKADLKSHGLYILESHLLKYEVIYPPDAVIVGDLNGDNIYLRENVHQTHAKEYWKKEGRMLKKGEEPVKIGTARPKWNKNLKEKVKGLPLNLYGYWQTEHWDPGDVIDNKIPRNEFGNVDLFKPWMLPRGASYLRLNGLLKIAQRLDIDCVPAVTGFDIKHAQTVPLLDGFVVPSDYEEVLTQAWTEEQQRLIDRAEEKYHKRVYGNWKRLTKGLLIQKRLREQSKEEFENNN